MRDSMNTKKKYWNLQSSSGVYTSNRFQKAAEKIEQGITLVKNRMQLIKLADRSEFGWRIAIEYEQNDLASDYEDEKRIQKSERAAERKLKVKDKYSPAFNNFVLHPATYLLYAE